MYFEGRMVMRAKAMLMNTKKNCGTGAGDPSGVIGTGPFKYSSHTATDFNLVRNDSYWRKDAAGKTLPYAKSLTWRLVESAAQRSIAIRTGKANIAWYGAAEAANFANLKGNSKLNLTTSSPENQVAFILNTGYMLNASKSVVGVSPFKSANARKAFAYAINQKKLVALGKGYYQGLHQLQQGQGS
jgi:ABC-type transport system substrate-binding protein